MVKCGEEPSCEDFEIDLFIEIENNIWIQLFCWNNPITDNNLEYMFWMNALFTSYNEWNFNIEY